MADVTLKYKGDTIAELSASGNKTIETAGKYCEADILLEYVKSGGGSLPSQISKIDGGSFTLTSDTTGTNHWISHNLGVLPKAIVIWTEDSELLTSTAAVAQRYIISSLLVLVDWVTGSAQNGIFPTHLFRNTNGATSNTGSPITQAAVGNYIQTTRFNNALGAAYYKANVEYKWIAFA